MKDIELFQRALGLNSPWKVVASVFDPEKKCLNIRIDFPRGSTFVCPECAQDSVKAYDTEEKTWRHLNFFQYETYLTARVPRIQCDRCGIRTVDVPWTRSNSGFTLLFEAMIVTLSKSMPTKTIASFVNEHDTKLWRMVHHYVDQAREKADHSNVRRIGIDETSSKRGHNYVTLFVDIEKPRILYVAEGKDASTIGRFKQDFIDHNGNPDAIEEVCCDMSPAFIDGVEEQFPNARITFDKFHVMKIINEAVDQVRREEQKDRPELARTRYIWLKNRNNLRVPQVEILERLTVKSLNLKTSRAYHIRLNFQELFRQPPEVAELFLTRWYFWATHSRLDPVKKAAYTIKRHWDGILRWFQSRISNGILEGLNSLIQAAKARARGYRTTYNLAAMIYLIDGKLEFRLPT